MLNAIAPIAAVLNVTHKDCFDGLVSAWVVRNWAKKNAYAYEVMYGDYLAELPDVNIFAGKIVVITDFSYPVTYLMQISRVAREIYMFDHHESAMLNFADLDIGQAACHLTVKFDSHFSGAGLTYKHLYPGHELPPIVAVAQDHDLWRFEYEVTKPVMAYLGMLGMEFSSVDYIHENFDKAYELGRILVEKDDRMVDWHMQHVDYYKPIDGFDLTIPIINAPRYIASKVADRLTNDYPLVIMYEDYPDYRKGSIRSNGKWGVNCAEIAKLFEGAGNPKAAGCKFLKTKTVRHQLLMKPTFLLLAKPKTIPKETSL